MSRGPGKLQEAILSFAAAAVGALTGETMRWSLYEKLGQPPIKPGAKLPTAWNTSFRRAIDGLKIRGRITINKRPLESFEECVAQYPGKTLKSDARSLRSAFLPVLLNWSREKDGLNPKYDAAANELHHLKLQEKNRAAVEALKTDWLALSERLRPAYGNAPTNSDDLLRLICKGRDLFLKRDIQAGFSLAHAVEIACGSGMLDDVLKTDLRKFVEGFIPNTVLDALRLRSYIHELAHVPSSGPCSLRKSTLTYLHNREKCAVEKLKGFKEKAAMSSQYLGASPAEFDYPPELIKLFDQSVFQEFHFVTLN